MRDIEKLNFVFLCSFRNSSRNVWRWIPINDPQLRSCCFTRPCLRCPYSSFWLRTASSATSVSREEHTHICRMFYWYEIERLLNSKVHDQILVISPPSQHWLNLLVFVNTMLQCLSNWSVCISVDTIPENALEEMTKNMDPNLVIVEVKDGVQMKWVISCWRMINKSETKEQVFTLTSSVSDSLSFLPWSSTSFLKTYGKKTDLLLIYSWFEDSDLNTRTCSEN